MTVYQKHYIIKDKYKQTNKLSFGKGIFIVCVGMLLTIQECIMPLEAHKKVIDRACVFIYNKVW